ncbi:MAG: tRNA (adenosine(37)-N6)-threonylcarbamoyltransferase complex ATPase subunit type 1 TsaE [Methylococcaceae bacterium]|nr:tRNA (adenosine(37)-N6)-threonylcarbamoyltransferase complex ATPase subunit type 1 TsaE [Methylococcaceae bacterium]MCI0733643.1 tRNA (adenosine(37)-N6)-threonylcarbamoyltransferase complex ATPase subunit type 1 TsaE [Methylococcaceae bacterium]
MTLLLRNEAETLELGAKLFRSMKQPLRFYLYGDLGSGKTTLVRGFLKAGGYCGAVKSPTFTLVEEYQFPEWRLVHLDLYRLADPKELEWIGIREYFEGQCVSFIEWPDRGDGFLPQPDLSVRLSHHGEGRIAVLEPRGLAGHELVKELS